MPQAKPPAGGPPRPSPRYRAEDAPQPQARAGQGPEPEPLAGHDTPPEQQFADWRVTAPAIPENRRPGAFTDGETMLPTGTKHLRAHHRGTPAPKDEVTRRPPHLAAMPITTVRNDAPQCGAGDPAIRLSRRRSYDG